MVAYFDRFLRRHLNALRLARWGLPRVQEHPGAIVVYCNHPAWWDAATIILLAGRLFPGRESHAPFDAAMLERYRIFRRIGAFGVDLDTARGAAQFLAASRKILARPDRMIWITAQGRFADVRARPLGLRPGVARLPEIAPDALFLPLALEYAFWDERGAEAFAAFGAPIPGRDLLALSRSERLARLESELTGTLDRLGADVIAREPGRFEPLLSGRKGIGGVYDLWRWSRAWLAGRRFDPAHRAGREAGGKVP
ncbi:lysophospholipid acyltransferase family protein [Methylobacterium nigriterrae]|uniref:lysophospholipid acyltransferase family protein n=1 Tax=Methylobacterium nigriterrae TaxID=3127512 RepID=UPI003013941A